MAFHIAENQPFLDGNKRTALSAAMVFLQDHGYEFAIEDDLTMYRAMIAVSEKSLDKYGLAELLDELVTK
ncbi:MAG: type II toxin-antitoxin system death-on-curing family toxin [Pyrinomonadaceae bacterium]|nr:type II toxin-antitoxin system death-on-curing family toxin [Pyrinomonadaceae bacterium]